MEHLSVRANGAAFHVAKTGSGRPLLLLHGWPEFWLSWEPVMTRLADRFTLYAPDLRGFGDSDKPEGLFGPDQQAADMLALMDALALKQAGIVGHDVGGALMQPLARNAPERIAGLFFFDFVYPGIGPRMAEPDRLNNIWYQSFHQMEMAPALVGASRETCRTYISHFLRNWSHRKDAFDDVVEAFTDNFLKAGNLTGGFAHYKTRACRTREDDEGRSAKTAADQRADLRALGRARSAVPLRMDRQAWRDLFQSRSCDVCRRRPLRASRRSGSSGARDRGLLHAHRMALKVGPPDATKHRRPRAASLKFWTGSAASPARGATKRP